MADRKEYFNAYNQSAGGLERRLRWEKGNLMKRRIKTSSKRLLKHTDAEIALLIEGRAAEVGETDIEECIAMMVKLFRSD